MIKLSLKLKQKLFNIILLEENPFKELDHFDYIIPFLLKIWDLKVMPSTQKRFNNAEEEIANHTINNNDWDLNFLFLEYLKIMDEDDIFIEFIETLIHPDIRETESSIKVYFYTLNPHLKKENFELVIHKFDDSHLPIYKIKSKKDIEKLPIGLKKNTIPFQVVLHPTGKSFFQSSHSQPNQFPSFVLVRNIDWNDYSVITKFNLFYYPKQNECISIGETKIMHIDASSKSNNIPLNFDSLSNDYCSLGQKTSYYNELKEIFNKEFESILFALQDSAFFPEIHDKFEKNSNFINSLSRTNNAERLLREAKHIVNGRDLSDLYSFTYKFTPIYSEESVDISFNFSNQGLLPNRIYGIIGKNGAGKTQLLTSLPTDFYKDNKNVFFPNIPLFSKVISISYSIFDSTEIPQKTATFNYINCGLRDDNGKILTKEGLLDRFHLSVEKIESAERFVEWRKILLNFIDKSIVNKFIKRKKQIFSLDIESFENTKTMLSSGQSIILYIITEIVANIRFDSLILYDEPETHLHPNAISELVNTIYELVNEFESYCIITTHSPLIIRELFSKNVFVLEKFDTLSSIRRLNIETFGANISMLVDDIFGNREVPKQYKLIIDSMISKGKKFDEIILALESNNFPLSLEARLYIKSTIDEES